MQKKMRLKVVLIFSYATQALKWQENMETNLILWKNTNRQKKIFMANNYTIDENNRKQTKSMGWDTERQMVIYT
jgi:hypothetical protein